MGRKVHPYGFRLKVIRDWKARWYAEGAEYADLLGEDLKIRRLIRGKLRRAGISDIEINPLVAYDHGKGTMAVDVRILLSNRKNR